jgi:amino acid transporter
MAAVFGIIAYITTGVVSAVEAIAYLQTVLPRGWEMDDKSATIGLLFFFCLLTNLGIKESAVFAKIIFVIHVIVLSLLSIAGTIFMIINPELLYKIGIRPIHRSDCTHKWRHRTKAFILQREGY